MPDERYSIFPLGDQAVTITLGNSIDPATHLRIIAMKKYLASRSLHGVVDIIVAYASLTVVYDAYFVYTHYQSLSPSSWISQQLQFAFDQTNEIIDTNNQSEIKTIPVCYASEFALDIDDMCNTTKLMREEIIDIHTQRVYQIYMIGFLPGFPYMAEVDQRIAMPRKETPRSVVPAGSVGVAGIQTGIYPVHSPGGWQIIGRTPLSLFNADHHPPVTLEAGDRVQFVSISLEEFNHLLA